MKIVTVKMTIDGKPSKVKYPVYADGPTDAEAVITAYLMTEEVGEFLVLDVVGKRCDVIQVPRQGDDESIWEVVVKMEDVDTDNGKAKIVKVATLLWANSIEDAVGRVKESLSEIVVPYQIASASETKLVEFVPPIQ
jgi:hypothetical protein